MFKVPKTEIIDTKDLINPQQAAELEFQGDKKSTPARARSNESNFDQTVSIDPQTETTKIVEGFTPGATKNIISFDKKGIFVYSATPENIKFEYFTKFNLKLQNTIKQLSFIRINSPLIHVTGHSIYLLPNPNPPIVFKFDFEPTTGRINNQTEFTLPLRNSHQYYFLKASSTQKSQRVYFVENEISTEEFGFAAYDLFVTQALRNQIGRIYTLGNRGMAYLLDFPRASQFSLDMASYVRKQENQRQSILGDYSIYFVKHPSKAAIYDYNVSRPSIKLSLGKEKGYLVVKLLSLKTKKFLCRKIFTLFDIMSESFENLIEDAKMNQEGPYNQRFLKLDAQNPSYIPSEKKIVGTFRLPHIDVSYSFENLFSNGDHNFKISSKNEFAFDSNLSRSFSQDSLNSLMSMGDDQNDKNDQNDQNDLTLKSIGLDSQIISQYCSELEKKQKLFGDAEVEGDIQIENQGNSGLSCSRLNKTRILVTKNKYSAVIEIDIIK